MVEMATVINAPRYALGLTVPDYLKSIGDNRARFEPHLADFRLAPADAAALKEIVARLGGVKVIGIGEDWCPDVHRGLPVVDRIADATGMELRFFPRDKNIDLINLFLKEGKYQSIPVFAFFDRGFNHLGHWIERPAAATRFQDQIRAELAQLKLSEDDTRKSMREKTAPLAESWRQETVREIRELLSRAAAGRRS
jgi:thiol-disulfide isomerase/thioredoxin